MSNRETRLKIADKLKQFSIDEYSFEHRNKHPCVRFRFNGKVFKFSFPGSPSDWRGIKNLMCDLQHKLMNEQKIVEEQVA